MAEVYVTVVWEEGPAGQKFLIRETPYGDEGDAEHDARHARDCGFSAAVEPRPR